MTHMSRNKMFEFADIGDHTFINEGVIKNNDLKDNNIINPFFVGIDGSNLQTVTSKDIYQNYPVVYIMCMKDNISCDSNNNLSKLMKIFDRVLSRDDFKSSCCIFTLIPTDINILKNYNLRNLSSIIDGNLLNEHFGYLNFNFGIDEIIVPMFEINESKGQIYSNLHNTTHILSQLKNIVNMVSYYNNGFTGPIDRQLNTILGNVDHDLFWKNSKNCNFNMDSIFTKRVLTYNGMSIEKVRYNKETKTLINNDNYIDDMNNNTNTKLDIKVEHMNIYHVLKTSKFRTFYAQPLDDKLFLTKESVAELFRILHDKKYRFKLLNSLLVSKKYCHLVVNNSNVISLVGDLLKDYKPLYAYLFGYAWITMYLEESIMSTKTTKKHRYVFDIDTANKLPVFPFSMENIHNNPYVTLFLNRDIINPATNAMGICSFHDMKEEYYGVCDRHEAIKRMNIFVSGNHETNIFDGLKENIFSVSGSIIPACIQKYNPLIDTCTSSRMTYAEKWNTYFNHFYHNSDVDVMCGTNSMGKFIKYATEFINKISENINCSVDELNIQGLKKTAVVVSKHFFNECLDDVIEETGIDYTCDTLAELFNNNANNLSQDMRRYFYIDYVSEKNNLIKKWKQQERNSDIKFNKHVIDAYKEITPIADMTVKVTNYALAKSELIMKDNEVYYFINDYRDESTKVPENKNYLVMKFSESLKFKISVQKLKRTIELFQCGKDPFNTVARFHKPCVRAYYQDNNIYMLPSCITAMMTFINIDYKYFAGSRDPIEIMNKYRMRAYSTILNMNEKKSMINYNKNNDKYDGMFKSESKNSPLGPKRLSDKIFKPGKYIIGLSDDIYDNKDNLEYINTVNNLVNIYKKDYKYNSQDAPINIFNFTAIGNNGYVKPLQTWVANAFYDYVNQNN